MVNNNPAYAATPPVAVKKYEDKTYRPKSVSSLLIRFNAILRVVYLVGGCQYVSVRLSEVRYVGGLEAQSNDGNVLIRIVVSTRTGERLCRR